jgi:hypothetical protein
MTVSLSLLAGAGWQFLDNSGNVLAGGRLFTYAAGTTIPLASYTSSTGLTANANPIILDSAGRVPLQIWLTDGSAYKFVLETSAGVQIGAWDNVYAPGVNSISFGTTGLTPVTATQGTVTVAGTLNVANGGTGLTSLTAGRIPFGNGTAAFDNSTNLTYTTGTSTLAAPVISAATSMANAGNMLFSGAAARIQGDFSNATYANRTAFQDKTTNSGTFFPVIPNGTSPNAGMGVFNSSDPSNAAYGFVQTNTTAVQVGADKAGTGTYLPLAFFVSAAEAARFDTAGRFMVGTTNNAIVGGSGAWVAMKNSTTGSWTLAVDAVNQTGTYYLVNLGAAGTQTGQITSNGTTTNYAITSDYRLKENVQPMTGALAKVLALNPVTYTWKRTQTSGQGFIAHELQAVIPDAVTGAKDDVDDEGNPRYQGVDTSHMVATLVAAIKELTARVAVLEARP